MAIRTGGLARFRKLPGMNVFVTIFANLRSPLELHLRGSNWRFVTSAAFHRSMRAKQRKLRLRMIKAADVCPGSCIVARFAAQRNAVRTLLRHAVLEFAVMRIVVAGCTSQVVKVERQDLVRSACGAHFVTIRARYSRMRST